MGYEEEIPPLPTRNDELKMIKRYSEDFIAQPSYKLYQNESRRKTNLDISGKVNEVKAHYWFNFGIGMLISAPFIYYSGSFFQRTSSGVPYYYRPKYFYSVKKYYNQSKTSKALMFQISIWLLMGVFYANRYTQSRLLDDEYLDDYKIYKML